MTLKHICSSNAPNQKDHIVFAHAADVLTSVSGVVRSSTPQPKIKRVDQLEPHLRENFGDQSNKIGPKESILVSSGECSRLYLSFASHTLTDNQGFLEPNNSLLKNTGGYTAVAPALSVGESIPAITAVQPRNLQTIFSSSKQDVDPDSIQRQIDDFKQASEMIFELKQKMDIIEQEMDVIKQDMDVIKQDMVVIKQEMDVIKQEMVVIQQNFDQLNENSRRHGSDFEQLLNLNTSMLNLDLQHTQVDSIRIRRLINRAPPCSVG